MTNVSRVPSRGGAPAAGRAAGIAVTCFLAWGWETGCAEPCCTLDGFPINLAAPASGGPAAGLNALAQDPADGVPFMMSIDTGSPLTFVRRAANERAQVVLRNFDLLDARPAPDGTTNPVVRGKLRNIEVLPLELDLAGSNVVLGGNFLRNFSVQLNFKTPGTGTPSLTFWSRLGAGDAFLASAGFAVLRFNLMGGAELTAVSRPDFLGLTGPVEVPPTRVVLRACVGQAPFDPDSVMPEACCQRGEEVRVATGSDLALVVATGVGPLVLSRSAWDRIASTQTPAPAAPAPGPALSIPSLSAPMTDVLWSTLPRLALVDQELDDSSDPGACVELGRARRLEWVERHQPEPMCVAPCQGACAQPCDADPRNPGRALNAAAYVELGDGVSVAVVPDSTPLLQGLRAEIRPEGPEIDGLVGAGVLAQTAIEIDYKNQPGRVLVTCAVGAPRSTCWTSPRCPRLSNPGDTRSCFGLAVRALPAACAPSGCG